MSRRIVAMVVASIVVFALLVAGGSWFVVSHFTKSAVADDPYTRSLPYVYQPQQLGISPTTEFDYPVHYDLDALPQKASDVTPTEQYPSAFEVYTDAALTRPADAFLYYSKTDDSLSIQPPTSDTTATDHISHKEVVLSRAGHWGLNSDYYLVQRRDDHGTKLAKPLVTHFTTTQSLPTPQAAFRVDERGVGHFSWTPVKGAARYYVVQFNENGSTTILGTTTKSTWTTVEQDPSVKSDRAAGQILAQNEDFEAVTETQDDLHSKTAGSLTNAADKEVIDYGVIAASGSKVSAYSSIDGDSIAPRLPMETAYYATKARGELHPNRLADIPTQVPITMADGTTQLRTVLVKPRRVQFGTSAVIGFHGVRYERVLQVPYRIAGTLLTGWYSLAHFDADYRTTLKHIIARNRRAQVKGGAVTDYAYASAAKSLADVTVTSTTPKVAYPVHATNPFTAYIAANMMKRVRYLDVSRFVRSPSAPTVGDALEEAIDQNHYVVGVEGAHYYQDEKVLEITYDMSAARIAREQTTTAAAVKRVVAKVITPGMSDRQKALALNDYLVRTARYDYKAYNYGYGAFTPQFLDAWTAAGVLIKKKGVCASYAYAYQLLLDEAGVKNIVVIGYANGDGHAWDKVFLNGKWTNVDPTWNDSTRDPDAYFGLTDAQIGKDHGFGINYVIPALLGRYAAN